MIAPRACVLLAAGHAERFDGGDKLLADLDGAPLAAHAARTARGFGFDNYFAVCPSKEHLRARLLAGEGFQIVAPERPETGAGVSLAAGVRAALDGGAKAVFVMLADMPFVTGETLAALSRALETAPAAFCRHGARIGPPAAFSRGAAETLRNLRGDEGAASVFRGAGAAAAAIVNADAAELFDVDCEGDLGEARRRRSEGRA